MRKKRIISIVLAAVILLAAIPAAGIRASSDTRTLPGVKTVSDTRVTAGSPSQKEEVIYGILSLDGSVDKIIAVNIFESGDITDYGDYIEVENLTTSDTIYQNGDEIVIRSSAKRLYCRGTLISKDLPWSISVKYLLNGAEISGSELAGKSGELEISIKITQNTAADGSFYKDYALQVGLKLSTELCALIEAQGATVAEAGGSKQISFTVLPGSGADISVRAEVRDFEMEAITLNGIKLSMDVSFDDSGFGSQLAELISAIEQLDDGAGELLDALTQLAGGMNSYVSGLKDYKDGISSLNAGIGELSSGVSGLNEGLSFLAGQGQSLVNGALAFMQLAFDTANASLAGTGLPSLTPENYGAVLADTEEFAELKARLDGAVQFAQGVKDYTDGVAELAGGASELADGAARIESASALLTVSANELYIAGEKLNSAIKSLRDGLREYKEGTGELRSETSGIDELINEKISELLGLNGETRSFVSEKNTNVTAVQFVLKTGAIEKKAQPQQQTEQPPQLNFFQKLFALFGLNI